MQTEPEVVIKNLPPGKQEAVEAEVDRRVEDLERFSDRITACRVIVEPSSRSRRTGNLYHVRVDLTVPGREIVVRRDPPAAQAHEDVLVAVRDAFVAAKRRLEDHVRAHWQQRVKSHERHPRGRVRRLVRDEGYGFLDADDGHAVYFHRNAAQGAFDELRVGQRVRFVETQGDEGPQASWIRPVGPPPTAPPPQAPPAPTA